MTIETTTDGFLGGRLSIEQPTIGYRAGVDPVLLAASVPARPGDRVLDLGCGTAVAGLCLAARVPGVEITGLERSADAAALAKQNSIHNRLPMNVIVGDAAEMPRELRMQSFDYLLTNPPYFDRAHGTPGQQPREAAFGESLSLAQWIDVAIKRLRPTGMLVVIQRAERLADLLAACHDRLGGIEILPIAARQGRAADRVILRGSKNARASLKLLAPLVMHEGARHLRDGNDYSSLANTVLRDGAALSFSRG
ncbi:MAG: methyltransferase [Pseudomonadota bacterium]